MLSDAAAHGLTGIHNPGITPDQVGLFKESIDAGKFTLRQYAMYLGVSGGLGKAATPSSPKVEEYGGKLTVKAVKFFMDGALGSWGAAMIQNCEDFAPFPGGRPNPNPTKTLSPLTVFLPTSRQGLGR